MKYNKYYLIYLTTLYQVHSYTGDNYKSLVQLIQKKLVMAYFKTVQALQDSLPGWWKRISAMTVSLCTKIQLSDILNKEGTLTTTVKHSKIACRTYGHMASRLAVQRIKHHS